MTNPTPSDHYQPPDADGPAVISGIDTRRVPHEVRWAVEESGDLLLDQLVRTTPAVCPDLPPKTIETDPARSHTDD
jgi:hypothetical protein